MGGDRLSKVHGGGNVAIQVICSNDRSEERKESDIEVETANQLARLCCIARVCNSVVISAPPPSALLPHVLVHVLVMLVWSQAS